jgi:SAM-dependent methyltransferase
MNDPDYLKMWRDLVIQGGNTFIAAFSHKDKAEAYETSTRKKNFGRRDELLEGVIREIKPDYAVLDIGAGTGRWTVPLAKAAARVTAVDPAEAMLEVLKRNAHEAGVTGKIDIINKTWEDADIGIYDFVISFHAIYMSADFESFIHKMEAHAKKRCYLGLRYFPIDGIIQELSSKLYNTRHDSPNFIIGYNALYQMGIYANVIIEETWHRWTDETIETALNRAKHHLHLENDRTFDNLVRETLERRLILRDGVFQWPDRMSTALVWWETHK